ncbi:MAG: hypothetical protein P8M22_08160 [Phycisphaerales bacterium]|nr:hypothetical protein [Phycisphaerales bacterium]
MKRRSLLLKLIAANLCLFVLAWILIPSDADESKWSTPPLIVLVVTILPSIWIWNSTISNDRAVEQ